MPARASRSRGSRCGAARPSRAWPPAARAGAARRAPPAPPRRPGRRAAQEEARTSPPTSERAHDPFVRASGVGGDRSRVTEQSAEQPGSNSGAPVSPSETAGLDLRQRARLVGKVSIVFHAAPRRRCGGVHRVHGELPYRAQPVDRWAIDGGGDRSERRPIESQQPSVAGRDQPAQRSLGRSAAVAEHG